MVAYKHYTQAECLPATAVTKVLPDTYLSLSYSMAEIHSKHQNDMCGWKSQPVCTQSYTYNMLSQSCSPNGLKHLHWMDLTGEHKL